MNMVPTTAPPPPPPPTPNSNERKWKQSENTYSRCLRLASKLME